MQWASPFHRRTHLRVPTRRHRRRRTKKFPRHARTEHIEYAAVPSYTTVQHIQKHTCMNIYSTYTYTYTVWLECPDCAHFLLHRRHSLDRTEKANHTQSDGSVGIRVDSRSWTRLIPGIN